MKKNQLLARYGLKKSDQPDSHAGQLLWRTRMNLGGIHLDHTAEVNESEWFKALQQASRQVDRFGGGCLIDPQTSELPLADIDPYMRGVVRWMNELEIHTAYCCDGHGKRTPYVVLMHNPTQKQLQLLKTCLPDGLQMLCQGKRISLETEGDTADLLLSFAERIQSIIQDPGQLIRYEAEKFKESLLELLDVPGESGSEEPIRRNVRRKLRKYVDDMYVDRAGNVLASIDCGDGPTVLLSAHMDVYREIDAGRHIVQEGTLLRSTSGILGADDRAGIAIILKVCETIHKTNFNGTLKIALTAKEEIGLVGSRNIDPWFMRDVDAAIVLDRRGSRDVVSSCRGVIPFCSPAYALLFEQAGILAGMNDWKVTAGGSSDARVYAAQFDIDAVNLSVGFQNEHTELEILDYLATYETSKLVEAVLHYQLIGRKNNTPL
jgi:tripeptide aminopeptidase